MPDLIAQGDSRGDRWRKELPDAASGIEVRVGRVDADWVVPWDAKISRVHLRLTPLPEGRLRVRKLETAKNSVYFRGDIAADFIVVPGEHFVIGSTTFTLANRPGSWMPEKVGDVTEHSYDLEELQRRRFQDSGSRIEMLSHLPDLILGSGSDEELLVRVTSVLLRATPSASAVAIVSYQSQEIVNGPRKDGKGPNGTEDAGPSEMRILHYDSRSAGDNSPSISLKLVQHAITTRESVLYLWTGTVANQSVYTAADDVDWAFCVPLRSEACSGWAIYVTGLIAKDVTQTIEQSLMTAPQDLGDDVKFAELVGTTIANLRQTLRLERRQSEMRHFFAPIVMDALAGRSTEEVLAPRETKLSVMFCDLRGFTRRSEQESEDLLQLLASVSDALGTMTRHILDTGGVIGDFHGDSAMGFWGWPLTQQDISLRAISAATRICQQNRGRPNNGFRCGIGLATGTAVAGRIGTADQVKVTAFGPVVNLASRLEGLTKAFGAEVIMDEITAAAINDSDQVSYRQRRLAQVRPHGFESPLTIFELVTNSGDSSESLSDKQLTIYDQALAAFMAGDWASTSRKLKSLPDKDSPKQVLLSFIARHGHEPPDDWDGVIDLPKY